MYTLFCPLRFIGWFGCRSSYFRRRHHRIRPSQLLFLDLSSYIIRFRDHTVRLHNYSIQKIPITEGKYLCKKDSSLALASGAKKSAPWHTYFFPISVVWKKTLTGVWPHTLFSPIPCCPPIMQSYGDILSEEKEGKLEKLLSTFFRTHTQKALAPAAAKGIIYFLFSRVFFTK